MRITREAKEATRERILAGARRLFVERGFDATTTRELAAEAGIAAGTLFNYYASKEALGLVLIEDALAEGREAFREKLRGDEGLEEALFLHVLCGLRALEPYRGFVGAVLETSLSPFARAGASRPGDELRAAHLEIVEEMLAQSDRDGERPSAVTLHLYWTLYLGALAFWSRDESPHQEDTLAVLDESLRVFALAIASPPRES